MAGIASRIQAIARDTYLAGHWLRELGRSLFWQTRTDPTSCTPGRVRIYRAPSWSWASVDGPTSWDFADLAPDEDEPAPIEIVEASTEVEGQNLLGAVRARKLVIRARTINANWSTNLGGWITTGNFRGYDEIPSGGLKIFSTEGSDTCVVGDWHYDDEVNGLLPGPPLSRSKSEEDISSRCVPSGYYSSTHESNSLVHGKEFMKLPIWERGTYVSEELVLIKGPTRKLSDSERELSGGRNTYVEALVLAQTPTKRNEYRRVGVGLLANWDEDAESEETITIV
jgi:hypothetical protein